MSKLSTDELNEFNAIMEASIGEALGINVDAAERDMLTTRIKQLETEMMSKIDMSIGQGLSIEDSESEFKRISDEISQLTSRLNALNEQGKTDEDRQRRIEDVKAGLEQFKDCTTVYNDTAVRKMIECIRVYPDGALDVIFGGGYTIHERVETVGK